jgi:hypothetical protein
MGLRGISEIIKALGGSDENEREHTAMVCQCVQTWAGTALISRAGSLEGIVRWYNINRKSTACFKHKKVPSRSFLSPSTESAVGRRPNTGSSVACNVPSSTNSGTSPVLS